MSEIRVHTKYIPPSERTLPALALQITELVGSYMVWVGTTDEPAEKVDIAPSQGSLLRDWACAMPPMNATIPPAGTNLYRSSHHRHREIFLWEKVWAFLERSINDCIIFISITF
ncbi:hypothetical protein BC629DRAFT_1442412 [Irpex lacteus]|nr:hypothetical protein BC629DRAFT_1442412 [Irpex lacteus]